MIKSHNISRRSAIKLAAGAAVTTNVSGLITAPAGSLFESVFTGQAMDAEQSDWFLIYGIIRYSTIFDEIYETQFAFVKRKPAASTEENKVFLDRPNIMLDVFKDVTEKYRQNNA